MGLATFHEQLLEPVREVLVQQLTQVGVPELKAAMLHLVGRCKLFRPVLALATYQALGGTDLEQQVPLVTPLELIHTFTLIHDDLPCMDNAELRRGVPAVHVAHGEAIAVLSGDALANMALMLLSQEPPEVELSVRVGLIRAATRATHAVVEGQVLDMLWEGRELTEEELQRMHLLKTGSLLGACCETGALLAGASPEAVSKLREYGQGLGLAFQIRDDLLSYESTEEQMGKTLSIDEAKEKPTYARLLGVDSAHLRLEQTLTKQLGIIADLELPQRGLLREITAWVGRRER